VIVSALHERMGMTEIFTANHPSSDEILAPAIPIDHAEK